MLLVNKGWKRHFSAQKKTFSQKENEILIFFDFILALFYLHLFKNFKKNYS